MKELIAIQSELKAPKTQVNKFGGYKYRKAEDILEAVKPLLAQQKCTLTITDDIVLIGNRIYVKATANIKNEKGECETSTGWAREEESKKGMDASQITGASSSYARKYALNGLLAIDDNQDSDTTNDGQQQTQQQAQANQQATNSGGSQLHPDNLKEGLYYLNLSINKEQLLWTVQTYHPLCSNDQFMQAVPAKKKQLGIQ